jgi:hypothetical protein
MRHDYHVRFVREDEIARIASEWRRVGGINNVGYFNIVDFIENILSRKLSPKKGALSIKISHLPDNLYPAYVTFEPTTLHVDSDVWNLAKLGEPEARYILAHEIGHIVLHDHNAKPFSNDPSLIISFAQLEHSAEWQANTFARYFLVPDHIIRAFDDLDRLIVSCGVPRALAEERISMIQNTDRKHRMFEGDVCPKCGNFTLVRNGTCLKCETCGATTGCS